MNFNIEKINNYLKAIILLLPLYYIVTFIVIAISRIAYPFDLEWMEGGMVEHVFRILNSQPIYTAPSLEFVPFIYTPLYFYISSWVAELTGVGFFPLRLVSVVSTLIIIVFTFLIVKKETSNKPVAIISAGLFAACFEISGFWFDLARVDALFLAFFVVSFFLLIRYDNKTSLILSGVLASLSILTKQTALIFILPLMVYIIYDKKWKSLFYIMPLLLITSGVSFYINSISQGWFYHWLVEIPAGHQWIYRKLLSFWTSDILQPLALAFIVGLFFIVRRYFDDKKKFILYLTFAIGLLFCSWSSRIHLGGYDNVLMPAFLGIAILFGLGLNEFIVIMTKAEGEQNNYVKSFLFIAVIAQFFTLFYNPVLQIPDKEDYAYGKQLIKEIKQIEGEVYLPDHQYITRYAGKKSYSHYYVLFDFFESNSKQSDSLKWEFENALRSNYFAKIISDDYSGYPEISKYYKLDSIVFSNDNFFKCKTGGHLTRPEFIFSYKE